MIVWVDGQWYTSDSRWKEMVKETKMQRKPKSKDERYKPRHLKGDMVLCIFQNAKSEAR
jgi:hypothetical protein